MKQSIKQNIHINSFKSKVIAIQRKEISTSFSYAGLITNCSRVNDKEVHNISKALGWLRTTKTIKLDFKNSKELTDQGLRCIAEGLRRLSSVQTFILNLAGCDKITEKGISHLAEGIKRLKLLRKFDLNLQGCSQVADKEIEHLKRGLQDLALLQDVAINFSGCYHITDDGFCVIMKCFKRPFAMRSLYLEFSYLAYLTSKAGTEMGKELTKLTSLESLTVRYQKFGCSEPDADRSTKKLAEGLKKMRNLKKINFDGQGCACATDKSLGYLVEAFSLMESLQFIEVNYKSCYGITGESLNTIDQLAQNPKIKKIDLNFSQCEGMTDEGLVYIAGLLQKHTTFENISLNFTNCPQISDLGMIALGKGLKEQGSLQSLSLAFESCCKLTDIGFGSIAESLKELVSLETANFNFGLSEQLSNKFCDTFATNVTNSLKTVKLNLLYCPELSDQGVASLCEGFKKLPFLESIDLVFFSEKQATTDDSLISLSQSFKTLEYLKSLRLIFQGCVKISDRGIISLSEGLRKCSSLKRVDFDFSW